MPESGRVFQRLPLALISRRDSMTDVAAKWLPRSVMWGALLSAIQFGDRGIETRVQGEDVFVIQVSGSAQDAILHGMIISLPKTKLIILTKSKAHP